MNYQEKIRIEFSKSTINQMATKLWTKDPSTVKEHRLNNLAETMHKMTVFADKDDVFELIIRLVND